MGLLRGLCLRTSEAGLAFWFHCYQQNEGCALKNVCGSAKQPGMFGCNSYCAVFSI